MCPNTHTTVVWMSCLWTFYFRPPPVNDIKADPGGERACSGGACVTSTLAVRFMSVATATLPLIEEAIVDSTP